MSDTTQSEYIDLHTTGLGYLNRARTVKPEQGKPYEAVSIAAIRGRKDNPQYTYYDTTVVGGDALDFITTHKAAINDRDRKVLVRFKISDEEPTSYTAGEKDQRRHVIKGRLVLITWASMDGEVILNNVPTIDSVSNTGACDDMEPAPESGPMMDDSTIQSDDDQDAIPVVTEVVLPATVKLDKNDPDFMEKKAKVKEQGYRWDRQEAVWRLSA